jgi:RNA polymerase sigma factor (sigma-70 family)
MDYSDLVEAVMNGDDRTVNQRCAEAVPVIRAYLIANLNASKEDAEDAVQRMFEYVFPKIKRGEIEKPSALLSYMLTGARHSYFKILNKYDKYESIDNYDDFQVTEARQIENLLNQEKQSILKKCMDRLRDHYRALMEFTFANPDAETKDIAARFDISISNAWARKHRATNELEECVRSLI